MMNILHADELPAVEAALGALARPLLEAAARSEDACVQALETLVYELKVICFCTGVTRPSSLRSVPLKAPGGAERAP